MAAAAQPDHESQCMDQLLKELAGPGGSLAGAGGGNPFRAFARRAALVITGLVHISVLLLPRQHDEGGSGSGSGSGSSGAAAQPAGKAGKGSGSGSSGASSSRGGGGGSSSGGDPAAELAAAGFPSDGSNLEEWQRVQGALERTATGGLDWTNCCVYSVSEEGGAVVAPQPPHPVSATAAYHAARVKQDALVTNDYGSQGPHFADWQQLYEGGARSMAAAPMYVQQRVVGVLNLASKDPHAFDRSRLVWLLALVLAPFVAALEWTSQVLEIDAFVARIMPPLLEQNYYRNTQQRRSAGGAGAAKPGAAAAGKGGSSGLGAGSRRERHAANGTKAGGGEGEAGGAAAASAAPPLSKASPGSDQFAQNAEVLITGGRSGGAPDALAPATPACSNGTGLAAEAGAAAAAPADRALLPRSNSASSSSSAGAQRGKAGKAARSSRPAAPAVANGWAVTAAAADATSEGAKQPQQLGIGRASDAFDPSLDPCLPGYDSDLDWGDFFFNLISMCIVYAYFSEAAVAGESQAAIVVSMCIAAIDIVLLALRWLWYEQYITYGGAVLQVFQLYRLVVLPVANTWMSWSLLNKLGVQPSLPVIAAAGLAVLALIIAGIQMRFLLHAPLQLASVLFAASATTEVCGLLYGSTSGLGCMGTVSFMQLSLGVVVPSLLQHVLDLHSPAGKPYLPHVQAKRWLLQA